MTCGVSSRRVVRDSLSKGKHVRPNPDRDGEKRAEPKDVAAAFEIAGTWDFKWPLGTTIRIAFQELPERSGIPVAQFKDAKALIREHARSWRLPATLALDFDIDDLSPPFEDVESKMDRHRSAFLPEEPAHKPYDVLISLQDLPVTKFDPFRGEGFEQEVIGLPVSALGSYARRADYGAPTMYLGRFGHFLKDDKNAFASHFRQPLIQNIVVHEFGHMLGLPHLHQHPDLIVPNAGLSPLLRARLSQLDEARGAFYKRNNEVQRMLTDLLGVDIPDEVVEDHLIRVWRGNSNFSDWHPLSKEIVARHQESAELDSIMTFPYYASTHRNGHECAKCQDSRAVHDAFRDVRTGPGSLDTQMLARMYEPPVTPEQLRLLAPKRPQ